MFPSLRIINLALVGVPSRRPVIQETFFSAPDTNTLPNIQKTTKQVKMSVLELKNLTDPKLKKSLMEQINVEDWTDRCSKCGYPKLIHKNLHRDATCTREPEALDVLSKHWEEYTKRIKPILRILKKEYKKDILEGQLLKGLRDLID